MTNKDKFREVFGIELCYCGAFEKDGCFYLISYDDNGTPFVLTENKQDAKEWLSSKYHPTKTHSRLVDIDELLKAFWTYCSYGDFSFEQASDLINGVFTIIETNRAESEKI